MTHADLTQARKAAGERGATLDMLASLMGGDLEATARRSRAVVELLTRSTCPLGLRAVGMRG